MLDLIFTMWTWFTIIMIVGFTPIVLTLTATSIVHNRLPNFKTIEYFGFVVSVTYWIVRCTGAA